MFCICSSLKQMDGSCFGSLLSFPDLRTGIFVAIFQDFGTLPVSNKSLNVIKRTEREESGRCFKN